MSFSNSKVFLTDGTNDLSITSAGALLTDGSATVQPISGTVTANAGTGNFTVVQATGTNLHSVIDSGNIAASQSGAWSVGRTWALASSSDSVASVQSGAWTTGRTWTLANGTDSVAAVQSGTWTVQQGTPPWSVSQSGTWNINNISGTVSLPTGAATEATLLAAKVDLDKFTFTSTRLLVDGSGVTQPVSGTITANQGTSPWVVSGTVTVNAGTGNFTVVQPTGTNLHTVLDSGTLTSIANALPAGTNVIGHVITDSGSTTAVTGNVTVIQPTGTNLHTVLDSGTLTSITNALPAGTNVIGHVIADSGSTTVVTGNVTVVQPTGTNLHTVVDSGTIAVTQSGAWTTGRTWTLASGTDSVSAVQSGTWTVQPGNTPNTSPWLIENRAPGTLTSYSAATLGLVAAATPTDIFTLYGSGTKTVKITRIEISATQNTAAIRDIVLVKRSATNTGGTSTAPTIVPYDSNNAAATATVLAYTANPASLGASVGNLRTAKVDIPATNLVGNTDRIIWTFGDRPSQAVVLRGTSQGIAINLNSVTSASNSFDISIEWTEE